KITVTYQGKAAHAGSAPWDGINALDAAVGAYVNVSLLRQEMKPDWRATGIITKGGDAANIIPEETKMDFTIRALETANMLKLKEKLEACLKAAATATGCSVELEQEGPLVENMMGNEVMSDIFEEFAKKLDPPMLLILPFIYLRTTERRTAVQTCHFMRLRTVKKSVVISCVTFGGTATDASGSSTDAGNVSHVLPVIHPMFKLNTTAVNHTEEFTKVTNTEESFDITLTTAKALALTAIEVMRDPELMKKIKKQFESEVKDNTVTARSKL
ncbi:unnamed protein product, partial [Ixodes hexagonus]